MYIYIYAYVYIYRERERDTCIHVAPPKVQKIMQIFIEESKVKPRVRRPPRGKTDKDNAYDGTVIITIMSEQLIIMLIITTNHANRSASNFNAPSPPSALLQPGLRKHIHEHSTSHFYDT